VITHVLRDHGTALAQLCEFIEDCEFTKLSVRILHLLGVEGPKAPQPSKYIRYIYNRVVLENAIVRAAAVSSLAKFGVNVQDSTVHSSIKVLLTRCLDDVDDEVRDRAALYLRVMDDEPLAEQLVRDGEEPSNLRTSLMPNDSSQTRPTRCQRWKPSWLASSTKGKVTKR
jgi:coatomer protein complex subunit gamma